MPDREKAIKAYENFVNGYECFCTSDDIEYEMHKAVLALLKEQGEEIGNLKQTAQSMMEGICLLKEHEAKTGKWIPVTNGRGGMECSICHDYAPSYQNGTEYLSKYCPNCGAKMGDR